MIAEAQQAEFARLTFAELQWSRDAVIAEAGILLNVDSPGGEVLQWSRDAVIAEA